jgi:hypothetical protein
MGIEGTQYSLSGGTSTSARYFGNIRFSSCFIKEYSFKMPESGGPTTQSGILYQNSIAALFLGRLLDSTSRPENERVVHLRVETPDNVDDIVVTFADNHKVYIQAKEDVSVNDSAWKKLWADFEKQFISDKFVKGKDKLVLWVGSFREEHSNLQELCRRAISSGTVEEWETRINKDQKVVLEKVKALLQLEFLEASALLSFFRHIEVEIHPSERIERDELVFWMPSTNIYPATLFRLLRDRVGGAARIRGEFTAYPLQKSLLSEDPTLEFSKPLDVEELKRSIKEASSLLRHHKHTVGNTGIHIRRSIVNEIVDWITGSSDDTKNLAMLIDQAGTGKTVVLHDVQIELEVKGYDVLAIKSDQQLSGIVQLADIGTKLGLNQSPEQILSRLSQLGRVAVLIDQIDALSLSLAHDQSTLDIVLDFVARLRRIPNLRILISCRLFDRNSDRRIQQIDSTQQFSLNQFTEDETSQVLESIGVSFNDLQEPTRKLLLIPLHLNLFALALESSGSRERLYGVTSLQELYGTIWDNIVLKDGPRAPSKVDRVQVIRLLKNYMAQHQVTSVPQSVLLIPDLAILDQAIKWLASTGIIISGSNKWAFIHQTFFDYCFAREFVEQGNNLVDEIVQSDQGLFIRPLLIQVISYMRGTNPDQYLNELTTLLSSGEIRFHLNDLLLRWFGSIPNPTELEWVIARRMLLNPTTRVRILQSMFGNPGWWARLSSSLLPNWLTNEESINDTIIYYLVSMGDLNTTQLGVIELLKPYLGKNEEWDKRLSHFVSRIQHWHSADAVEFYEQVIYRIPSINNHDVYKIGLLAKAFPKSGVRLLRFILDLVLRQYDEKFQAWKESGENASRFFAPSIYGELHVIENHNLEEAFPIISRAEPKNFLEILLPWLDNVLARQEVPEEPSPFYYFWDQLSGNWYNDHHGAEHALIFGLIYALVDIIKTDSYYFDSIVAHLDVSPFRTPQLILAHVFKNLAKTHATQALHFILADHRRLELGEVDDYESRKLIEAIYPYLSEEERSILEDYILQPPLIHKNRGLEGLRWRGIEQFHLLQSIPSEYLSQRALRQLNEWEHKFPGSKPVDDPKTMWSGSVESPIPIETAKKMSDRQWLRAINKYHSAYHPREFLKGGADQLSSVLQTLVKEDPIRYFSLLQRVNDDVDDAYVHAFINGLAESPAPIDWLFDTVRRFSQQPNRNIRRTIAWAIDKRAKEEVPNDIIELFLSYVHSEPGEDEWWWAKGENHGDVFSSFFNSDRGTSFYALMRIYDGQKSDEAYSKKWDLIQFAETDPSTALHIGAIHELTYMIRLDRNRAMNAFDNLMKGHEILLESHYTREFIYWALYQNYLRLQPYINKMMHHEKAEVQEQGAQLACIAAISNTAMESEHALLMAQTLAEETVLPSAPVPWKKGAAMIYSHNITGRPQDVCIQKLYELLKEEDKEVQDSIGRIFYSFHEEHFFALRDFIEMYARLSKSENHKFTEYLLDFGLLAPEWTLLVLKIVLDNRNFFDRSPWATGIEEVIRLVLKIYTFPAISDHLRKTSMDLFDILIEKSPGFSQKVLSEWDQR